MFSPHIGTRETVAGVERIRVKPGELGHAVYGQHQHVRPGRFRVEFELACTTPAGDLPDATVATIDVTAHWGRATLVRRELAAAEMSPQLRPFALDFTVREFRALEYRVHTTGRATLLASEPRLVRVADADDWLEADPRIDTQDPVELHRQVRAVLGLLRPQRAVGQRKVRLGHAGDGGYVCLDDFDGLDAALSLGINDDISWDLDAAARGLAIEQFDHTVEDPAPADDRMTFNRLMIAPDDGCGQVSMATLISKHDKGRERPNLLLKMDIEGAEWAALETVEADMLGRFAQIVCELHYFQGLAEIGYRTLIYDGLRKLHRNFGVVHVHANVCGGISNLGNVVFPNVLEVSFVNRSLYDLEDTDELFPGALDVSCDAFQPDMYLGAFRF